jgi:pimeloyl-ACP methyl ester carboxylesterase
VTDTGDTTIDGSVAPARARGIRWWPLAVAVVLLVVAIWAALTEWSGIRGSHPAYAITLTLVVIGAVALGAWALRSRAPTRSPARTWIARVALVLVALILVGVVVYLRPLSADDVAIGALADGNGVTVDESRSSIVFEPDGEAQPVGLVFYPGGLVDPRGYSRLLRPIAEAGYRVVVPKFPFSLAVLSSGAAGAYVGDSDDSIERWVVGGHSLGGAMASEFARTDRAALAGLLLWAAYPVNPLADRTELQVLSVAGGNDEVAKADRMAAAPDELPPGSEFVVVEGAVHAFFGDYGPQPGDGTPSVEREVAQAEIVDATIEFLDAVAAG